MRGASAQKNLVKLRDQFWRQMSNSVALLRVGVFVLFAVQREYQPGSQ
jgi:hypothetical protein